MTGLRTPSRNFTSAAALLFRMGAAPARLSVIICLAARKQLTGERSGTTTVDIIRRSHVAIKLNT